MIFYLKNIPSIFNAQLQSALPLLTFESFSVLLPRVENQEFGKFLVVV